MRASHGDGGGAGGSASAVEKRSVPGMVGEEEHGARGEEELEGEVAGALELKWPPWEGLADRYKLIGATSLAFVICNMDKVSHLLFVSHVDGPVRPWQLPVGTGCQADSRLIALLRFPSI